MTLQTLDRPVLKLAGVIVLGALTPLLDMTMVVVALARIADAFDASVISVQWISAAYLLAIALTIPVTGRLVERFGARTMWLVALTAFLVGSALCAAAWSVGSLIAFRVVQGFGGGMIVPLSMMILARAAGPDRRGRVLSLVAIPSQFAPIAGPLLGGLLVQTVGWRWIFLVDLPIGVVAILLAWKVIPAEQGQPESRIDRIGLVLLTPAIALLVLALTPTAPWPVGLAGLALLIAFTWRALTADAPLLDLRLFKHRSVTAATVLNFISRLSIFGAMIVLPLYFQQVRGHRALDAGLLLAPQSLGTLLALPLVGRLTDRIGARPVVLGGVALTVAGTIAFTQVTADTGLLPLAISMFGWGIGVAAVAVPVSAAAYYGLDPAAIPNATSLITTIQTVGASVGAAVLTAILQSRLAHHPTTPAAAYADTFWWILAFTTLAFLPALLLVRRSVVNI